MCLQILERHAARGCLFYKHPVDPCPLGNQRGHSVQTREVRVGYACWRHSASAGLYSWKVPSGPNRAGSMLSNQITTTPISKSTVPQATAKDEQALARILTKDPEIGQLLQEFRWDCAFSSQNFEHHVTKALSRFGQWLADEAKGSQEHNITRFIRTNAARISHEIRLLLKSKHRRRRPQARADPECNDDSEIAASELANPDANFIISSSAYRRLRRAIRHLTYPNMLRSIKTKVLKNRNTKHLTLNMLVHWEVPEFCDQELDQDSELSQALSIGGTATKAWATTCCDYLRYTWPATQEYILKALDSMRRNRFSGQALLCHMALH